MSSGVRRTPSDLHYGDRALIAQHFPIGIDPEAFRTSISSEATQSQMNGLRETFHNKKMILGVDRLDYIKGIPQKLYAFEKMLNDNPEWIGKVVLVQVCIPTRSTISEYKALRKEVEGLVGRINGTYGLTPQNEKVR
jgi:trehalose-6-phosphate synthase